MKSNDLFRLKLNHSELLWLAGVMGYIQFPLLGIPKDNASDTDLEAELRMAQATIQDRGLALYLSGSGWQVDRLVVALTQVIANPESVQILQTWTKAGISNRAFVYPNLDFPLFVEEKNDDLEFTLHSGPSGLVAQKQAFFELPVKAAIAQISIRMVHPEEITPLLWNSSEEIATERIMETGRSKQQAGRLAKVLRQMVRMGSLTNLISTEGDLKIVEQQCLLWSDKNIWGGPVIMNGESDFVPLSSAQAVQLLV
jgi:hypothetical protein